MPEFQRREFLKLVGASAGAAATVGCEPVTKLIPYVVQPEEIVPGIANHYASTCQECPAACGLHVTTREGRPIKLEGNPAHPVNKGALCARGQASIGRTYHPDRYRGPLQRGADGKLGPVTWDAALKTLAEEIQKAGDRTWVLGGETGPTASKLLDTWVAAVGAGGRVVYEPLAPEALRHATSTLFGVAGEPIFDLSATDFVIDFGSDFLESGPSPTEHARQLSEARDVAKPGGQAARFVYVGPRLSMTASSADEWVAAKPGSEGLLALAFAKVALGANPGAQGGLLAEVDVAAAAKQADVPAATIERIGRALGRAKAPALIPPGVALASRRASAAATSVLLANVALGALGKTLRVVAPREAKQSSYRETLALVDAMKNGQVAVLIVHGSNPAYSLPPASGFADALGKVPFVVSLASVADETSERASLILPDHAPLESWGDAEARPGIRGVVQPTLRPLYDTRSMIDTLLDVARAMGAETAAKLPGGSFRTQVEQSFAGADWHATLKQGGVFTETAALTVSPTGTPDLETLRPEPALDGDGEFTLVAAPGALLYDGRGANLPWLQEVPDPVTKVAWESFAELSPRAAEKLGGVVSGDVIALDTTAGSLEVPVVVRSGLRDDVIALAIGQGHTVGLWSSRADVGFPGEKRGVNVIEVLPALTDEAGGRAWLLVKAKARSTGRHHRLPFVHDSQNQRGRRLGLAVTLAELAGSEGEAHGAAEAALPAVAAGAEAAHGEGAAHAEGHGEGHEHGHEMLKAYDATRDTAPGSLYRWGMSIDIDKCTGCSACVVACYIENNISIVGEEQTRRGRHMAWLRIERWIGDGNLEGGHDHQPIFPEAEGRETVDIRHAPMLCQQCGAAPCEPVCPVIATYHNDDGLNGMIYNRCIGTRYCANNCPYKVRKFNWFDFALERWPEPMYLMANPDVTMRGQGVMEKCTFCVQRVSAARQPAKDENRLIRDGEVTTACAQACATGAITFGNMKDAASAVVKAGSDPVRGYHSLHELNTRSAVTYLAKVTRGNVEG